MASTTSVTPRSRMVSFRPPRALTPPRQTNSASFASQGHELLGLPGFRTYYGEWTLSGPNGLMIPVRNKASLIQGIKIRLDDVVEKDTALCDFGSWLLGETVHVPALFQLQICFFVTDTVDPGVQ